MERKEIDRLSQALIYFVIKEIKNIEDKSGKKVSLENETFLENYIYYRILMIFYRLLKRLNTFTLKIDFFIKLSDENNIEASSIEHNIFEDFYWNHLVSGGLLNPKTGYLNEKGNKLYDNTFKNIIQMVLYNHLLDDYKKLIEDTINALNGYQYADLIWALKMIIYRDPELANKNINDILKEYDKDALAKKNRFRLIHLSDIHLTDSIKDKEIDDLINHMLLNVKDKSEEPIDAVLISGDGIDKGATEKKYERLKYFIDKCSWELFYTKPIFNKIMYLPGNHDLDRDEKKRRWKLDLCRDMIRRAYIDGQNVISILDSYYNDEEWSYPILYEKPIQGLMISSAFIL